MSSTSMTLSENAAATPSSAQLVTRARALGDTGRYDEARDAYRQAIAQMPRNAELLLEFGVLAGRNDDLVNARRVLEKAARLDPNDANIPFNLAQVAKAEGQYERAVRLFRQTLQLDPDYHEALVDQGDCLLLARHAEEALEVLDKAVEVLPGDAMAHNFRALALDDLDRPAEANAAYRRALQIDPAHLEAELNLAANNAEMGAPWGALDIIDKVEAEGAMPQEGYSLAARVLHLIGQPQRALAYIDKCIEADVDAMTAIKTRASIAMDSGNFDSAETDLRHLLEVGHETIWAYQSLAVMNRLEPQAASRLKKLAKDESEPPSTRATACFALYRLLDKAGDYEQAFATLDEANRLKSRVAEANVPLHLSLLERIAQVFSPDFLRERASHGYQQPGAIYIVGMPRSGTTLTEQMLAAHPRVYPGGERQDVMRLSTEIPDWPTGFQPLTPQACAQMGHDLHDSLTAGNGGADFTTEKTPGHYVYAGFIHALLPAAKLVYVRRNPGDNLLSLYEQHFANGANYSYNLDAIVEVYKAHRRLMHHWTSVCGLDIHTVDYDALVADPEPHIRALLDFIGLDFHPDCLKPEQVQRAVSTASVWQVRQPISTASSGRWKRYERQLAPYVSELEEAS